VDAPLFAARLADAGPLRDGALIRAGDVELVAVSTPGHTSDHFAFHLPVEAALFTGDAILGRGTSFIDPPDGDLVQYLRSLERMRELRARTIYPGHGPIVLDAQAKIDEYLEHRAEREIQVLDALEAGRKTVAEIVAGVYADYPQEVWPLAERSVLAHLLKLEGEGRVAHKGTGDGALYEVLEERACRRCGRPIRGHARYCGPCSLALLQDSADRST
jgi:glyoxylase-like metal-dependent hydrolase (beta-lactamase superfamily II)